MAKDIDLALQKLSLLSEEDEEPYEMPDLPEFKSCVRSKFSILGRALNPDCQRMSSLILDMPRKWQKYDRVCGLALSNDRFQFIFDYENDLLDILNKVNYYTTPALTKLGDFAGEVIEVAFDPNKPHNRDYVRVKVKVDVSKPLRRSKIIKLPDGTTVTILYNYERVQKRCFTCQRLTHAQDKCPIFKSLKSSAPQSKTDVSSASKSSPPSVLQPGDPLFGVLDQLISPANPSYTRIAEDVLQEMRLYLASASDSERRLFEERLKSTVASIQINPVAERSILQNQAPPATTKDIDKGKGIVFGYEHKASPAPKLMNSAFPAINPFDLDLLRVQQASLKEAQIIFNFQSQMPPPSQFALDAGPSGSAPKRAPRRRISTSTSVSASATRISTTSSKKRKSVDKGKADDHGGRSLKSKVCRNANSQVVPTEGPLNQ
ncbi:uncharacterized protein LOC112089786 [Eutrema salsugineum]|uniref:uncharacterized protein LOC112089786 n=1 Tax=Eutrema salsugineum TaxID=72664 RepID=UPI000CECEC38|nr:uncharacterized protein LOC112089786 [Eutrema salsugineum]